MDDFTDFGFQLQITGDGSPTLRLLKSEVKEFSDGESMHHMAGAASETVYLYEPVLMGQAPMKPVSLLSLGLGLGYVEILVAYWSYAFSREVQLWSFEKVPQLRENFKKWILEGVSHGDPVYLQVASSLKSLLEKQWQVNLPEVGGLKNHLREQLHSQQIHLHGSFEFQDDLPIFNGIFYDAFSRKTDLSLWDEGALTKFLKDHSANHCILASYACLGPLKRALAGSGFQLNERAGFSGKRHCTLAKRLS